MEVMLDMPGPWPLHTLHRCLGSGTGSDGRCAGCMAFHQPEIWSVPGAERPGLWVFGLGQSSSCCDLRRYGDCCSLAVSLPEERSEETVNWTQECPRFVEHHGYSDVFDIVIEIQSLIVSCVRRICQKWIMLYPRAAQVAP